MDCRSTIGTTASGATVDFGSTTVTGMGGPGSDVVPVPFELTVPGIKGSSADVAADAKSLTGVVHVDAFSAVNPTALL